MSKFKNFMWKTFFPTSYKCNEIAEESHNQPTVKDLLETQANDNDEAIAHWREGAQKLIYNEWVDSIAKKKNLKWNARHEMVGDTKYEFSVLFHHDGDRLIKEGIDQALECVLVAHPDMRFSCSNESSTTSMYHFDYSDCLEDPIPLDMFENKVVWLLERWKKKRNH